MTVSVDGAVRYRWHVSTGATGFSTPATAAYPNLPYSAYQDNKPTGSADRNSIETDKPAFLGTAYLRVFDARQGADADGHASTACWVRDRTGATEREARQRVDGIAHPGVAAVAVVAEGALERIQAAADGFRLHTVRELGDSAPEQALARLRDDFTDLAGFDQVVVAKIVAIGSGLHGIEVVGEASNGRQALEAVLRKMRHADEEVGFVGRRKGALPAIQKENGRKGGV